MRPFDWFALLALLAVGAFLLIGLHFIWDTRRQLRSFISGQTNGITKEYVPGTDRWMVDAHDLRAVEFDQAKQDAQIERLEKFVEEQGGRLPYLGPFVDARIKELKEKWGKS